VIGLKPVIKIYVNPVAKKLLAFIESYLWLWGRKEKTYRILSFGFSRTRKNSLLNLAWLQPAEERKKHQGL
jgi:hypothetical protein